MFSDEPEELKEVYKKLGHSIGVIFQLADDCADYEATEKAAKKPVLSDFNRGVITLPLIYALKKEPGLREKIGSGITADELKAYIDKVGGLSYTRKKISEQEKALKPLISQLDISQEKRERLSRLLNLAKGEITGDGEAGAAL
jgi:heptaprenyl diphosphate synthase